MRGFALFAIVLLITIPVSTAVNVQLVRTIPDVIDTKVAEKNFIVTLQFAVQPQEEEYVKGVFKCPEMRNIIGVPVMFDDTSLTPTVQFKSKPVRELNVKCTFFAVIKDQVRAQNFSIEKKIDVNNNPLGEVVQAQSLKINEVTRRINEVQDRIDKLQKLVDIFGLWCTISKLLARVNTMIQNLKTVLFALFLGAEGACLASIFCSPTVVPLIRVPWSTVCTATSTFHRIVNTFIWPVGFFGGGLNLVGIINKWGCSIFFDCLLANVDQLSTIAVQGINTIDKVEAFNSKIATKIKQKIPFGGGKIGVAKGGSPTITGAPGGSDGPRADKPARLRSLTGAKGTFFDNKKKKEKGLPFIPKDPPQLVGEPTMMDIIKGNNLFFNPYKSIHYASVTMCIPAVLFNLKKDKQIKCLYRNCMKAQEKTGGSFAGCDVAFKERHCLYVESAQFKQTGYKVKNLLQKVGLGILKAYVVYIAGEIWQVTCSQTMEINCAEAPVSVGMTAPSAKCGAVGALLLTLELVNSAKSQFGFGQYEPDALGDQDFCESQDVVLGEVGGFFIPANGLVINT
ncbi:MAG: hypothetical protein QF486_00205 [Candidatus Woesearchaeota archaeon]|jgi:hypothetical protein|nr:hypothetical protein [Candidatus Woesearchaeota archaeon]MDP7198027.1 hypothetical protein [Candidatus Woesearchaeota archaeon]MDP7466861.1 hypothetical protein [Candidatus Woesearchaeota archaeon]MDP7647297.1 hypothetical protein [Candidatus Woesearchaeota archaeon]